MELKISSKLSTNKLLTRWTPYWWTLMFCYFPVRSLMLNSNDEFVPSTPMNYLLVVFCPFARQENSPPLPMDEMPLNDRPGAFDAHPKWANHQFLQIG